jgi:hypothetical protein
MTEMAAGGEDDDGSESAPLHRAGGAASGSWRRRRQHHEGCPGCRLDEANKADTGVPYRNFSYIWAVCLAAGEFPISLSPRPSSDDPLLSPLFSCMYSIFFVARLLRHMAFSFPVS